MSVNTDTILIGGLHLDGERVAPSHIAQLHVGSVAKWELRRLSRNSGTLVEWWPVAPEKILPDLLAMVAIHVMQITTDFVELKSKRVNGSLSNQDEIERLGSQLMGCESLCFSALVSPSSAIQKRDLVRAGIPNLEFWERSWVRTSGPDSKGW